MAAYGGALRAGKTPQQAIAYLTTLYRKHVIAQPSSAREALQTFLAGKGDDMPSWRGKISEDQARDLVTYTRSFASTTKKPGQGGQKEPAPAEPTEAKPPRRFL